MNLYCPYNGGVSTVHSKKLGFVEKLRELGTILGPNDASLFRCPLGGDLCWEAKDVFNPAAVVHEGKVWLLYRAEDSVGPYAGTSRIGLAVSDDGRNFARLPEPVLYPDQDEMNLYERGGGCEDPRVVWSSEQGFVMTYSAFDGILARLCVATSPDLKKWTKRGLAFKSMSNLWSKAGSIVCRAEGDRLVPVRIEGKYWMYWGESYVFVAASSDLIDWYPVKQEDRPREVLPAGMPESPEVMTTYRDADVGQVYPERHALVAALRPRRGRYDSLLVEPGPPALLTDEGIILLYHGKNASSGGDKAYPDSNYSVGLAVFDSLDPTALIYREIEPILSPTELYETHGQISHVCFAEGLVHFRGEWLLYYGSADSGIAMATIKLPSPAVPNGLG